MCDCGKERTGEMKGEHLEFCVLIAQGVLNQENFMLMQKQTIGKVFQPTSFRLGTLNGKENKNKRDQLAVLLEPVKLLPYQVPFFP